MGTTKCKVLPDKLDEMILVYQEEFEKLENFEKLCFPWILRSHYNNSYKAAEEKFWTRRYIIRSKNQTLQCTHTSNCLYVAET